MTLVKMDSTHRYFELAHSSDAVIASYRTSLIELSAADRASWENAKKHAYWVFPTVVACIFGSGLLQAISIRGSNGLGCLAFALVAWLLTRFIRDASRLADARRSFPVKGHEAQLEPLIQDSPAFREMQKLCEAYPACRVYVDSVRSLGRSFYGFDANYVTELAEVLKRDTPLKHTIPVDL